MTAPTTTQRAAQVVGGVRGSRLLENVGFGVGLVVALTYGVAEALSRIGLTLGDQAHADHGIPWGLVIIIGVCVLPKTVGKATSGRLWDALASRVSGAK